MSARVSLALLHHPVRDREGATITTAVTNLDVHDIARSARTYDLSAYYLVTPIEAQRALIERILEHWRTGAGARRVPERSVALALCRVVASLEEALADAAQGGARPRTFATGARPPQGREALGYDEARARIAEAPSMLLFGTGHGLARSVVEAADYVLAPIRPGGYNHLSVRAAVAITLDRLFGDARSGA
ncbi:MAG TPA: RNA methyltransferase [Sandaracinaceae bacterium]